MTQLSVSQVHFTRNYYHQEKAGANYSTRCAPSGTKAQQITTCSLAHKLLCLSVPPEALIIAECFNCHSSEVISFV
jgi:hypothetical protein